MILLLNFMFFVLQIYVKRKNCLELEDSIDNILCILTYPFIALMSYMELYNLEDRLFSYTPVTENLVYFMFLRLFFHFFLCRRTEYKIHHFSFSFCLGYILLYRKLHYYAILSFLMEFTQVPLVLYYKTKNVLWGIVLWLFFIVFRLGVTICVLYFHFQDVNKLTFFENIISKLILTVMTLLNVYWFMLITKKIYLKRHLLKIFN